MGDLLVGVAYAIRSAHFQQEMFGGSCGHFGGLRREQLGMLDHDAQQDAYRARHFARSGLPISNTTPRYTDAARKL